MQGFPFDSQLTYDPETGDPIYDRAVSSQPLRTLIRDLFTTGIMPNPSTNLQVSAGTDGMTVQVDTGFAVIDGGLCQETDIRTLEVTAADDTYDRIDTVVVRWNENVDIRRADLYIVAGTPAANPVRPELQRDNSIYEIGLADVFITRRVATITNDKITDTRYESERCGIVSSVSEWDTTTIYQQVQADLAGFKSEEQAEFLAWFETIQDILDENVAAHLQNEIDALDERLTPFETAIQEYTNGIGSTNIKSIGDGTITGAIKQIDTSLSNKLNKSGDSLLVMGDLATAGNPAIHLRSTQREIRDAISSTGDYLLFDYTSGAVKNIVTSSKNGINTFGGVGLRVNNGVAQYSPNNGTSWLNFKNPTGTKSITANGTYDVTDYASAQVNVGPLIQQVGPAVYVASQGYSWNGAEVGRYYAILISIHQGYNQTFEPPASMSGCQVISTTGVVLTYTPVATAERDRMRMYFVKATSTTLSITNVGQSALNVAWLAMRVGW